MIGYFALRSSKHASYQSLQETLLNPFDDQCVYLSLLIYLSPYVCLDEAVLSQGPEAYLQEFDRVLNPLMSWLKHLEQVKAPAFARVLNQSIGGEITQIEQMWRQLIKEKVKVTTAGGVNSTTLDNQITGIIHHYELEYKG